MPNIQLELFPDIAEHAAKQSYIVLHRPRLAFKSHPKVFTQIARHQNIGVTRVTYEDYSKKEVLLLGYTIIEPNSNIIGTEQSLYDCYPKLDTVGKQIIPDFTLT